jgi:DnaK suppressor protein
MLQPLCARPQPLLAKKEPTMSQQIEATPRHAKATLVPERHLPRLRAELEQQQRFRLDQIDELASEAALTDDEARWQVMRALIMAAEWALGDINWALQRLDRGTYGTCERCTAPVPLERLNVLPMARLCMPCQRRSEASKPGGRTSGDIR